MFTFVFIPYMCVYVQCDCHCFY